MQYTTCDTINTMNTNSKKYVDGYVIPLKKKDVAAYKKMAQWGAKTWKKYGALEYFECIGDDLKVKKGMGQGFTKLANLKPGETVAFSWIVYKSKKHRDEVNKKVMAEMNKPEVAEKYKNMPMPFDMKRFSFGGFGVMVEA
jgi:uncharacterized protein YbaA (DUF1428 family)